MYFEITTILFLFMIFYIREIITYFSFLILLKTEKWSLKLFINTYSIIKRLKMLNEKKFETTHENKYFIMEETNYQLVGPYNYDNIINELSERRNKFPKLKNKPSGITETINQFHNNKEISNDKFIVLLDYVDDDKLYWFILYFNQKN